MIENSVLMYSGAALALLMFGFLFSKLRTKYIQSLFEKINSQEEHLGKLINQLAAVKTINQNLENNIGNQQKQIEEMVIVNSGHSDKLTKAYTQTKKLIQDVKKANLINSKLKAKLNQFEEKSELELEAKVNEIQRVEASYKKVSHSFEIMQKSNDNLREERDFYRQEFMKLRENLSETDTVAHIKSA